MSNDKAVNPDLSTSWGQVDDATPDGAVSGSSGPVPVSTGTHLVPKDPGGFTYDDDLFTTTGVPTPEEQVSAPTGIDTDRDQIITFLKAVYPTTPAGVVTFTTFTVTGRSINTPQRLGEWTAEENNGTSAVHDHAWLADRIASSVQGARPLPKETAEHFPHVPITGAFLRMPTTMAEWPSGNQRGGQSNVCELVGFVLDGDYNVAGHHKGGAEDGGLPRPDSAEEVLSIWAEAIGGQPTLVWNSGGGINGAWLLDEPIRIADGEGGAIQVKAWRGASQRFHERVVRTAKGRGFKHDSVPNNDRLMRIPGTMNAKKGVAPKMARLVSANGPRYELTDLLALAPEPAETEDGSLVDAITGEVIRGPRSTLRGQGAGSAASWSDDGETPWDHYDREVWENSSFRDLLARDGWREEGFHGGILHFWRPGKGEGQQISATLGANDGTGALSYGAKFFVFSDNAPGLFGTTYKGQFLSPSLYQAVAKHGGDKKASASALRRSGYGTPRTQDRATPEGQTMTATVPEQRTESPSEDGESTQKKSRIWDEPIPLEEAAPAPYDLSLLGDLGEYTRCSADAIAVPHGMALMMNIGAVSAAIGGRRTVKVRHRWNEPVILHTLALAPPGSRKSAAQNQAFAPILAEEDKRRYAENAEVLLDQTRRSLLEDRIKEARKKAASGKTENDRREGEADLEALVLQKAQLGTEKQPLRMTAADITPEELANLMARQGERMCITESEASFLSNVSGQYSTGGRPKLDLVLSAYDHQKVTVDRVSKEEPVILHHPSLTIAIAVQGDSITGLGKSCAEMDKKGAWGRFLYDVSPNHTLRTRYTPEIPREIEDAHTRRVEALMAKCYDDEEVREMVLSSEAADIFFDEYYVPGDPNLKADHYRVRIKGWDDKQPGRAVRLAALITLYNDPDAKEIGADAMRRVLDLDETMTAHAHRASGYMTLTANDPLAPARDVLDWIEGQMFTRVVRANEVQAKMRQQRRPWCSRLDDVLDALTVLEEYGHIAFPFIDRNGDPEKRAFIVHPKYADAGAEEPVVDTEEGSEGVAAPEPETVDAEDRAKAETDEERLLREAALRLTAFGSEFCRTGAHAEHWVFTQELLDAFSSYVGDDGWLNAKRMGLIVKRVFPDSKRSTKRDDGKQVPVYRGISIIPAS